MLIKYLPKLSFYLFLFIDLFLDRFRKHNYAGAKRQLFTDRLIPLLIKTH